jgi:replicative DNA helicase
MKYSQQDLEMIILAHITTNAKLMDKLIARGISEDHFDYIEDGDRSSYTKAMFKLAKNYFAESGGSLLSSYVLEAKLDESGAKPRIKGKFLALWEEIHSLDIDENDFFELVSDFKHRRSLKLLTKMFTDGHSTLTSEGLEKSIKVIQDGLDSIQTEMNELGADRHSFDITESSEFFNDEYMKRIEHPELFKGINCGISNIDSKTFGWLPGQIIVFLAPSSGGKSVMLLNSAVHANEVCNKNVLYMSFEMNSWLCLLRHVSLTFEIPYSALKDNALAPDELKSIINGLSSRKGKSYFEYDVNMEDPTPEYIDSRIRDLIATKGKPDLLVVDYIGNMTIRNAPNGAKDWENQSKAIQQLFIMAKRYGIPVITAQQINRETIRDSRKQKEANKFMSYDQAAASGGQNLMHLCTYAIAMEPNREQGYCILHPVKMRDAWFQPFPITMDSVYNKVREMDEEEQQNIMGMHSITTGAKVVKTVETTKPSFVLEDDDEEISPIDMTDDNIEMMDWNLG